MPGAFSVVPMSAGQGVQAPEVIYGTSGALFAGALGITPGVRVHKFTGSTSTITSISGSHEAGAVVTIIFQNANVTVSVGKLAGGVDFVSTAESTLTLAFDGTSWYEVSRAESLS